MHAFAVDGVGGSGGHGNPGGNGDPKGFHSHTIDGLGATTADVAFNNHAQVIGAKFGLNTNNNSGSLSFQNGAATLIDSYKMDNGATLAGNVSYLNGNYSETISGSDQFHDMTVTASFNSSNTGAVDLNYQAAAGVSLNLHVDTNGMIKGGGMAALYESNGWKVGARADMGQGSSGGAVNQASIYLTHQGPQPQFFSFAVGNSSDKGVYFDGGINIPFN